MDIRQDVQWYETTVNIQSSMIWITDGYFDWLMITIGCFGCLEKMPSSWISRKNKTLMKTSGWKQKISNKQWGNTLRSNQAMHLICDDNENMDEKLKNCPKNL